MRLTIPRLLVAVSLYALDNANAAGLSVGASFSVKVTASSQGSACEMQCWELWVHSGGLGSIMVVKNSLGQVVEAGRLSEAYFLDMYQSVDEATRKIPTSMQTTRLGTVSGTTRDQNCYLNCTFTVDFGAARDVILGLNSAGKIGGARESDDSAEMNPLDYRDPPAGRIRCVGPNPDYYSSCASYDNIRSIGLVLVSVWSIYDDQGNLIGWIIRHNDGRPDLFVPFPS